VQVVGGQQRGVEETSPVSRLQAAAMALLVALGLLVVLMFRGGTTARLVSFERDLALEEAGRVLQGATSTTPAQARAQAQLLRASGRCLDEGDALMAGGLRDEAMAVWERCDDQQAVRRLREAQWGPGVWETRLARRWWLGGEPQGLRPWWQNRGELAAEMEAFLLAGRHDRAAMVARFALKQPGASRTLRCAALIVTALPGEVDEKMLRAADCEPELSLRQAPKNQTLEGLRRLACERGRCLDEGQLTWPAVAALEALERERLGAAIELPGAR